MVLLCGKVRLCMEASFSAGVRCFQVTYFRVVIDEYVCLFCECGDVLRVGSYGAMGL